jgi:DNA-binding transcriptional regulator PaaX
LTAVLTEIIQIKGLPECFCGFTATQLFLCTHSEVVATAWDWEEITRRHNTYLKHLVANVTALQAATNHAALARIARIERQACAYALARDPLLPRSLWPQSYLGHAVWDRHLEFRDRLRKQFARLTTD